jgi:ABC-type nitrate/sulfonate/bicarbonate transport system substrate-binding protein
MHLTFAHYRNRFCMFRTYYALAEKLIKPDDFDISVVEVPDPPSRAQEEMLIEGKAQVANLYFPNFLGCKLAGAPIIGIATEWKSTLKGNGIFVRAGGPVRSPGDLSGRLIASHHKTPHATHRYLLKHCYGVDETSLRWVSYPQEELLDVLRQGKADAVVLIDQFFFKGEQDPNVRCLYTDGEGWRKLHGFAEFIKHMIAIRESLLEKHPELRDNLLSAFRASLTYSEEHLAEIADEFVKRYPGDKKAALASARYPKIEFTFTDTERQIAEAEMEMLVETGELERKIPLSSVFAV